MRSQRAGPGGGGRRKVGQVRGRGGREEPRGRGALSEATGGAVAAAAATRSQRQGAEGPRSRCQRDEPVALGGPSPRPLAAPTGHSAKSRWKRLPRDKVSLRHTPRRLHRPSERGRSTELQDTTPEQAPPGGGSPGPLQVSRCSGPAAATAGADPAAGRRVRAPRPGARLLRGVPEASPGPSH